MRPTFNEQIDETCRLLEDIVMPAVTEGHPSEILRGLIGNLRMLNAAWPKLAPFLAWDNEKTGDLIRASVLTLDECQKQQIRAAGIAARSKDIAALTQANQKLRGLLCDILPDLAEDDPHMKLIGAHLAARAMRYPMRSTLPTPKSPAREMD
ncbi:MAG: hypothetical protein JWO15_2243 [Sphingomonadales bacterium]|nr:hypothetical protein [Sphingomonadales bacterium]